MSKHLGQHGGEGEGSYKGKKSDDTLKQHGGEGSPVKMGGEKGLLHPEKMGKDYCGPGRYLGKE